MKIGLVKSDIPYKFKGPVWDISKGLMDIKWNKKETHIYTYLYISLFLVRLKINNSFLLSFASIKLLNFD